jgi:hypothetical protein
MVEQKKIFSQRQRCKSGFQGFANGYNIRGQDIMQEECFWQLEIKSINYDRNGIILR